MARQAGEKFITGNYEGSCFYKMEGRYYIRSESSLTGKRVKSAPRFRRTMELAYIFGIANKLANEIYRQLPKEKRGREVRYELIRQARKMIAEGSNREGVIEFLRIQPDHEKVAKNILKAVFKGDTFETGIIKSPAEAGHLSYCDLG
jgi:hypothetical protein